MTEVPVELLDGVRERLARDAAPLTPQLVAQALREQGRPVGDATVLAVHDALHRDVVGAGPLEPLLRLEGVTDVLVNGAEQVWIDRGAGLERTGICFPDDQSVRRLAQRLAAVGGRRLDDASPYVDLRLPDGTRFHAVLAPAVAAGHRAVPPGATAPRVHDGRARRGGRCATGGRAAAGVRGAPPAGRA